MPFTAVSYSVRVSTPTHAPRLEDALAHDEATAPDEPWVTLVWNDPVNLMSYVAWVFQRHFGYSQSEAESLMLDVHHKGKAVVARGNREKMESDTEAMHGYGLWATFQKDA